MKVQNPEQATSTAPEQKTANCPRTEAEVAHLRAQVAAMLPIVRAAWNCSRDGCDYDGGSIQDEMLKAQLLVIREAMAAALVVADEKFKS